MPWGPGTLAMFSVVGVGSVVFLKIFHAPFGCSGHVTHATKISFDDDDDDFALIKQRLRGAAPGGERKSRPRGTRDPLHTRFL